MTTTIETPSKYEYNEEFEQASKEFEVHWDMGREAARNAAISINKMVLFLHEHYPNWSINKIAPPLTNCNDNDKKIMNENEYNNFLKKLYISKGDLHLDGKLGFNRNLYKVTTWIHPQSEIKFIRKDYLEGSDKYGNYEYDYKLPGLSIN